MGTKSNPGNFDCYANAEADEPLFVLLGRDPSAAFAVRQWIKHRIAIGKSHANSPEIAEARSCVQQLEKYSDAKVLNKVLSADVTG